MYENSWDGFSIKFKLYHLAMRLSHYSIGGNRLTDLVPVANVILLLVFFFLLSWSFVLQRGIEVRLPSTTFQSTSQQGRHIITLKTSSSAGQDEVLLFFDENGVSEAELDEYLKLAAEKTAGDWITVNADDSISHGRVQKIISMAMEHGFHVTIATQQPISSSNSGVP